MKFPFKHNTIHSKLTQATAFFLLVGKLLSFNLWIGNRNFPIVPVADFLHKLPSQTHIVLLSISIIGLVACTIKPAYKKAILLVCIAEVLSCLLDQNRWQPWEYQYVFMLFVLWVNRKNEQLTIALMILIFASTYFYSGCQKFNPHFLKNVWKHTMLEQFFGLPKSTTQQQLFIRLGYLIPFLEIVFGLGLLFNKTRKKVMILLIAMHLLVLTIIGPWGNNYNLIVWPWNTAMIVFFLIIWEERISIPIITQLKKLSLNSLTIFAWTLLPILNFFGYWDYFFSSSLYGGRIDMCYIQIKNAPLDFDLKPHFRTSKKISTDGLDTIVVQTWAMDEFNTPSCPQKRVYLKIKEQWQKKYPAINASFILVDRSSKKIIYTKL